VNPDDFTAQVIRPALAAINLGGLAAEQLLLGTALQESGLRNIRQSGGPALGYFQMEPATHNDIWTNFLMGNPQLAAAIKNLLPNGTAPLTSDLISFPIYAAAMARVHYLRVPAPLPAAGDLDAQAAYYKKWYNTPGGAATTAEYIANWSRAMVG